jgi:hypothetical protein
LRCQKQRTFHGDRNRIKTKTTEKKKRKLKRRGREIDDGGGNEIEGRWMES